MPVFLLTVVGTLFSVSGLIFVNGHVVSQRLTDWHAQLPATLGTETASWLRPDEIPVARAAQKLRALRNCLDITERYYAAIQVPHLTAPQLLPAPHFSTFQADNQTSTLVYTARLGVDDMNSPHRALFRAIATDKTGRTTRVVVKFTSSYGKEAHQHMVQHRAAPQLLYCAKEATVGGLVVVVMEYVDGLTYAENRDKVSEEAITALKTKLHNLHEKSLVFGDLRPPNVIISEGRLVLIDFDWSGKEGEVHYPLSLNESAGWHAGVE